MTQTVLSAARTLSESVNSLEFSDPVAFVYNPLEYAWDQYRQYVETYGAGRKRVIFLGMNPGPWGMAQTGVPFGEINHVRHWLGVDGTVGKPEAEHPKRPVEGFSCRRSEVSGSRLWSFFAEKYGSAAIFFADHFVANYCPLVFMEQSGKNRTPDKLRSDEKQPLFEACDRCLIDTILLMNPEWLIGIGKFAEERFGNVAERLSRTGFSPKIGRILHPSPASPAANRGWAAAAEDQLVELGVWKR
jgi:single-strand selective monofunctional uracil DNA glycosylase